jgi:hypothetical protein
MRGGQLPRCPPPSLLTPVEGETPGPCTWRLQLPLRTGAPVAGRCLLLDCPPLLVRWEVDGDVSGDDVWRLDMTAVMARPEPARHVDPVRDRCHGGEVLSVS